MTREVDVVVLGGGVAGLVAAAEASADGAAVALVEPGELGGGAAHRTLVPLRALERALEAGADRDEIWARARREAARVALSWRARSELRLEDRGVERLRGRGRFTGPDRLAVGETELRFDAAVVAVGGEARRLGEGPRVLTPERLLALTDPPDEVLVVGGGAGGAELTSALSLLEGTSVTWLMDELGILPDFDRELAESLGDVLMGRGVKLVHGKRVLSVRTEGESALASLEGGRTYAAPFAVVCVGTKPRTEGLDLEAAGLSSLRVDGACRTGAARIWAAGECTPGCPSAAAAEAMGRVAGRAAAGRDTRDYDALRVPRVVHAAPALAQIGLTPESAAGREVALYTLRTEETIFGALEGVAESLDSKGFLRIVCDASAGEVIGASGAGPGSIEMIGAVGLAMEIGATARQLGQLAATLPGPLEALVRCVR